MLNKSLQITLAGLLFLPCQLFGFQTPASQHSVLQQRDLLLAPSLLMIHTPVDTTDAQLDDAQFDDAQPDPSPLPDAPSAQSSNQGTAAPAGATSTSRQSAPTPAERLTVGGKLRYFANESFRPGVLLVAAFYTGLEMANPPKAYPREWRQGAGAFGRNYGDFMASWTALQGAKFVVAAATREDPRYVSSTSKNMLARGFHALTFVFIDQSDSGHNRLALSNFAGALAGGFVGGAYLPDGYNNVSHAGSRSVLALTGFLTSNLADEFHPEVKRVARKLHIPFLAK